MSAARESRAARLLRRALAAERLRPWDDDVRGAVLRLTGALRRAGEQASRWRDGGRDRGAEDRSDDHDQRARDPRPDDPRADDPRADGQRADGHRADDRRTFPEDRLAGWYPGRPLLLGHRGAMARAPENTLGAFRAAIDDGGDGWELDTQLAGDDVAIVLHDDTLDRTTNGAGPPLALSSHDLRALDAGTWFDAAWGSERVPTLDEALACAPDGKVVNVEIKGPTPAGRPLERAVVEAIRRHVPRVRVVVSSFDPAQLMAVRRLDRALPVGLLVDPHAPWPLRTLWPAALLQPDALHPPASIVDQALVVAAHKAGMRVHVWAVADDADAERLLALGVDGLIVDDVRATRAVFERAFPIALRR